MTFKSIGTKEVADRLGVSETRIAALRIEGRFPNAYKTGKFWIYPISDVDQVEAELIRNRKKYAKKQQGE